MPQHPAKQCEICSISSVITSHAASQVGCRPGVVPGPHEAGIHHKTRGAGRIGGSETMWSQLDPHEYPFTRSLAGQVRAHDDRVDFLAGIDLILRGIDSPRRGNRVLTRSR